MSAIESQRPRAGRRHWPRVVVLAYRRIARTYYAMTQMLVAVAGVPALRRRMVRMLARHPDVFDLMPAINAGQAPLRSIQLGEFARLVGGILAAR